MFATCVPANAKKRKRVVPTNSLIIDDISQGISNDTAKQVRNTYDSCLTVHKLNPFQMSRDCSTLLVPDFFPDFFPFGVTSVGGRLSRESPDG